jgi:hypothetical protein
MDIPRTVSAQAKIEAVRRVHVDARHSFVGSRVDSRYDGGARVMLRYRTTLRRLPACQHASRMAASFNQLLNSHLSCGASHQLADFVRRQLFVRYEGGVYDKLVA